MPKMKRMRRGQTKGNEKLEKPVMTRINKTKYDELCRLAAQSKGITVSGLIRRTIHNQPVKVFVQDDSLNTLMEELAANRSEIKAIGVNINQITRYFNTYPEPQRKQFYAKMAFHHYQALAPKIDRLMALIEKGARDILVDGQETGHISSGFLSGSFEGYKLRWKIKYFYRHSYLETVVG